MRRHPQTILISLLCTIYLCSSLHDPALCSSYSTCDQCSNQKVARCGWCASDANGNGMCLNMSGTGAPIGNCSAGYWDHSCCSQYKSCDDCSGGKGRCQWCEKGSKVNGATCIPFDGTGAPTLGGCDAGYYTNWCCRDLKTCDTCSGKGWRCRWCMAGSTKNGAQCLPYDGTGVPMYGGCDSGYYSSWCCLDFGGRCDSCLNSKMRCGFCANNSKVNPGVCLVYDGTGRPMMGGCDSGQFKTRLASCPTTPCPGNCSSCEADGTCVQCRVGFWGPSCEHVCNTSCLSLTGCDMDSGACFGCEAQGTCGDDCSEHCMNGWSGCEECDQGCGTCTQCASGLYGPKCGSLCTHCLGFECDPSSGVCTNGCTKGWSGPDCQTACLQECPSGLFCINGDCGCPPGYVGSFLLGCRKANTGLSCDQCKKLVGAAKTAAEISHYYKTYEEATAALGAVTCLFLPPPIDIGCALAVTEDGGFAIVSQITDELLQEGFCAAWGACTGTDLI